MEEVIGRLLHLVCLLCNQEAGEFLTCVVIAWCCSAVCCSEPLGLLVNPGKESGLSYYCNQQHALAPGFHTAVGAKKQRAPNCRLGQEPEIIVALSQQAALLKDVS